MKLIAVLTRYPEELHGAIPYMVGELGDKRAIMIDADVDGYKRISLSKAAELIGDQAVAEAQRIA